MSKAKLTKSAPTSPTAGNTVRFHRVLATKPEKVYRAFVDADAIVRWLPPYGFTALATVAGTARIAG